MPRGADDRFWREEGLPSVFKHTLLDKYVPQFASMTGSRSTARKVVILDGYAGRGRYGDGRPASAELVLRMAQNQGDAGTVAWTCFFVEAEGDSAAELIQVVDEYVRQGVAATAHRGDVLEVLDDVVRAALGCPLFVSLDPCGLGIPYDRLTGLLRQERRAQWPPTEVLLNFSLEAVRRIAGHVGSELGFEATRARLDEALGGDWWRAEFNDGGVTEQAVETVVRRFVNQLAHDTGMHIVNVPVRRAPRQKPVYHLVFGTRAQHGLWAFADSTAQATEAWWATLEERTIEQEPGTLFPVTQVERPSLETIETKALAEIEINLELLLRDYPLFRVVDHTIRVFGSYYGQVRETLVREAIKNLHRDGRTSSDGVGRRIRNLIVARPQAETARRSGMPS
jgi:three-Cys-motif partner protein